MQRIKTSKRLRFASIDLGLLGTSNSPVKKSIAIVTAGPTGFYDSQSKKISRKLSQELLPPLLHNSEIIEENNKKFKRSASHSFRSSENPDITFSPIKSVQKPHTIISMNKFKISQFSPEKSQRLEPPTQEVDLKSQDQQQQQLEQYEPPKQEADQKSQDQEPQPHCEQIKPLSSEESLLLDSKKIQEEEMENQQISEEQQLQPISEDVLQHYQEDLKEEQQPHEIQENVKLEHFKNHVNESNKRRFQRNFSKLEDDTSIHTNITVANTTLETDRQQIGIILREIDTVPTDYSTAHIKIIDATFSEHNANINGKEVNAGEQPLKEGNNAMPQLQESIIIKESIIEHSTLHDSLCPEDFDLGNIEHHYLNNSKIQKNKPQIFQLNKHNSNANMKISMKSVISLDITESKLDSTPKITNVANINKMDNTPKIHEIIGSFGEIAQNKSFNNIIPSKQLEQSYYSPHFKHKINTGDRRIMPVKPVHYMNKLATYESLEDSLEFKKPGTAKSKATVRGQSHSRILANSFNLSEVDTIRSQDASYTIINHDNQKKNSRNITVMRSILEDSINNRETMTQSSSNQTKQVIRESIHTLRSDSINMRASSFGGESHITDEVDQHNDDNNSIWNDDQDPNISRNTLMKASSNLKTSKLKTLNHLTKIEYTGPVKKMCLLGSGSEAKVCYFLLLIGYINHFNKVYLVKIKDFDELLALKQYEVVKNNGRSIQYASTN